MFATVPGAAAAPPAYGLVAAAARPDPASLPGWEQGLAWTPERCATGYRLVAWCEQPGAFTPYRPEVGYYQPVEAQFPQQCSTMSGELDIERVRRMADAQAPFAVARELWEGDKAAASSFEVRGDTVTNAYLASPQVTVVGNSATPPLRALGRLEHAALEASAGQPVMLHVPVDVAWLVAGSLFRVGQSLLTAAGNVVVADGAYTGTGPTGQAAGATVWAYATGPVTVLMSPWDVVAGAADTVDRGTNTRTVWASRMTAAVFDPCVHAATEITLT